MRTGAIRKKTERWDNFQKAGRCNVAQMETMKDCMVNTFLVQRCIYEHPRVGVWEGGCLFGWIVYCTGCIWFKFQAKENENCNLTSDHKQQSKQVMSPNAIKEPNNDNQYPKTNQILQPVCPRSDCHVISQMF